MAPRLCKRREEASASDQVERASGARISGMRFRCSKPWTCSRSVPIPWKSRSTPRDRSCFMSSTRVGVALGRVASSAANACATSIGQDGAIRQWLHLVQETISNHGRRSKSLFEKANRPPVLRTRVNYCLSGEDLANSSFDLEPCTCAIPEFASRSTGHATLPRPITS